jgi:hypothetical protein
MDRILVCRRPRRNPLPIRAIPRGGSPLPLGGSNRFGLINLVDDSMRTRRLTSPWPFLLSVLPKRGLVQNLPPKVKKRKPRALPPAPAAHLWVQEGLL